jgi:hypothetical protein
MTPRPTSYEQFTLPQVQQVFSLTLDEKTNWTLAVKPIEPSDYLKKELIFNTFLTFTMNASEARSEIIISSILSEISRRTKATFFFDAMFDVNKELGLQGSCDFIVSPLSEIICIDAPVLTIVQAKNESIVSGLGQCLATMVAAQMFNQGSVVYGAVTTGDRWKFLKLVDQTAYIAPGEITLNRLGVILGVLEMGVLAR